MTLDDILAVTEGHILHSDGSYSVLCPSHPDTSKPSLRVTPSGKGVLLHCFTGCTYAQIIQALQERLGGSAPSQDTLPKASSNGSTTKLDELTELLTPLAWLSAYTSLPKEFLETQDLDFSHRGEVWFVFKGSHAVKRRVAKTNPEDGKKWLGWKSNGDGEPPLWPTPDDTLPPTIFVTAGETDCLCLRACEVEAFALTKGEGTKVPVSLFSQLKSQGVSEVVYSPDLDRAGEVGSIQVKESVERAGLDFTLLDLTPHANFSRGEKDIRSIVKRVGLEVIRERLAASYSAGAPPLELEADDYAALSPPSVPWILRPYLVKGGTTLVAGRAKSGKTTFVFKVIAALGTGGAVLNQKCQKGKVLVWTENSPIVWKAKLDSHLPNTPHDHVLVISRFEEKLWGKDFASAISIVAERAHKRGCSVLVVDTLTGMAGITDQNAAADVSQALIPCNRLAQKYKLSIVLIHHLGKSGDIMGSTVFKAEPDILLTLEGEHSDPRILQVDCNLLIKSPEDITFKMDDKGNYQIVSTADQNADILDLFSTTSLSTLKDAWEGSGGVWSDKVRQSLSRRVKEMVDKGLLHEVVKQGSPGLYQKVTTFTFKPI